MRHRARTECWFGRLYRPGEEADFAPGTRVPAALFEPLETAPAPGMAALRRRARDLGIAPRRTWTARDLAAAISAAESAAPDETEARHGQ